MRQPPQRALGHDAQPNAGLLGDRPRLHDVTRRRRGLDRHRAPAVRDPGRRHPRPGGGRPVTAAAFRAVRPAPTIASFDRRTLPCRGAAMRLRLNGLAETWYTMLIVGEPDRPHPADGMEEEKDDGDTDQELHARGDGPAEPVPRQHLDRRPLEERAAHRLRRAWRADEGPART